MNWIERAKQLAQGLAGDSTQRALQPYQARLKAVNALEPELRRADEARLRRRADRLRERACAGTPLNDLLVETFALVREVARREIGLRPFDVQILGGLVLHEGQVAQMQTGEGKTLAAVAPVALNAFSGRGVHVLTFNDYLARRDAEWMGPIYRFLGLRVGSVQERTPPASRRAAYRADVTYVTAKEAGFDFLRDALIFEPGAEVHHSLNMALVDEADSILIDEARIPLVIAGDIQGSSGQPERLAAIVRQLAPGQHYAIDYERQAVHLTDEGLDRAEALLGCGDLHTSENLPLLMELNAALYAAGLMRRDVDYIVRHGRVEVVDEFTGRVVEDRHWPDGLQAAIEAKEGLRRSREGQVLGQITLQHFLGQYRRLCGMTATAKAAADELLAVYGLDVVVIPPNRTCVRVDHPDVVFGHREDKQRALVQEIARVHATGRPILVGTLTVKESEQLAASLQEAGLDCDVLNARRDAEEARIVAQAGKPGAMTISTNMAGRGTDIRLGGSDGTEEERVVALGGLYVIGTNRHESRRVDDQLRGRAGRQGDPGTSRFFISLEDDLLRRNGIQDLIPDRYKTARQPELLDNPVVRRQIAHVQRVVKGRNADVRRELQSYSRVVELQRRILSRQRRRILDGKERYEILRRQALGRYERVRELLGEQGAADLERRLTLLVIDRCWADHLAQVAEIMEGIHLAAIGGLSPLEEFQKQATRSFERTCGYDPRERQICVSDRLIESFNALPLTGGKIDLAAAGLRGPSSTWTYLMQDDAFKDPIAATLVSQRHIGFSAGAALTGPLLLLWALWRRFQKDN